jgi:HK97 family phage major capsid protein
MTLSFPALKAKEDELARIFAEAGADLDLMKVKSLDGKSRVERTEYIRELNAEVGSLREVLKASELGNFEAGYPGGDDGARGGKALAGADRLTKGQKLKDWLTARESSTGAGPDLDLGRYLKGLATGNWSGAEAEQETYVKAQSVGSATAGGHLVPTPLAGSLIDLARNQSRIFQAGAVTVPMTSSTHKIPRLTGEGTPGWRAENAAIADADLTFDAVTFTAKSLNRMVKISVELMEDSDPGAGGIISSSFAAQIAQEIDRVALRGAGTATEPRGILNTVGITGTGHGANGAAITNYDWWLDAAGAVSNANYTPNAHIQTPRSSTSLAKLKDTTGAYLAPPASLLPMLTTKNVPSNLTVGTSTDCSEIYTAQWDQLMIGIRTELRIEVLRERFADNGQYAFLAWFRGDVQVAQPTAFVVDTGVRG